MSIDAHLATLEKKHGELEAQLRTVQSQPSVHDDMIVDIKRRKLRLKDEINRLRADTQH
ncbi:MAG: YdcH family protein [Hoeflea sp.]|uniref:YdcH family protein n=1 Tax=Hoeflea sp. TaxID=1940281 RepID=UPI003EF62C40